MDMEEQIYDTDNTKIGECETESEYADKMDAHNDMMHAVYTTDAYNEIVSEMWNEKWSEYA